MEEVKVIVPLVQLKQLIILEDYQIVLTILVVMDKVLIISDFLLENQLQQLKDFALDLQVNLELLVQIMVHQVKY